MTFCRRPKLPPNVRIGPIWRRRPLYFALLLGLVVLAGLGRGRRPAGDDQAKYHNKAYTVTGVADGDTIYLDVPDGDRDRTRVRLWGVDTPETGGGRSDPMYFGPEAEEFARKTLTGRRVRILLAPSSSRDKYGRLLAYVTVEDSGESFNEMLLSSGMAYADGRFEHPLRGRYRSLEAKARKRGVGLWARVRPEQMPEWRQRLDRQRSETAGDLK